MAVEKFSWVGIGIPVKFVLSTMNGVRDRALGALVMFDGELGGL